MSHWAYEMKENDKNHNESQIKSDTFKVIWWRSSKLNLLKENNKWRECFVFQKCWQIQIKD